MRKMKQVKRWAALIAAAAIAVAMLPGMAQTAKAVGETGTFTLDGIVQTGTLIDSGYVDSSNRIQYKIIERSNGTRHLEFTGSGDMPNFSTVSGTVDEHWKYYGNNITSAAFGKGITRIGDYTLGAPGSSAGADLQNIWLPEGLLEIGEYAFYSYGGSYIRIPSTVTTLSYCSLSSYSGTNLTFPASLTYIGYNVGHNAKNLYYPGTEAEFSSKVKGSSSGSAEAVLKAMQERGTFGATDRNYDNYYEYVPFTITQPVPTPDPDPTPTPTPGSNPFVDVPSTAYYFNAVIWAVSINITGGTSATTFSPNNYCTRAQAMTFLWKACGSPTVSGSNRFVDVPAGSYYYSAVLWATQNGITSGTSSTTFGSNDYCTRAQIATFMYKANGSASVSASIRFTDVSSGSYYYTPVRWMVENNITGGTSATTFSPNDYCTRAQIVTFLYKNAQ